MLMLTPTCASGNHNHIIFFFEPTTGNKIVETLYSNRVTSEKVLVNKVSSLYDVIFAPKTINIKNPKTYGCWEYMVLLSCY